MKKRLVVLLAGLLTVLSLGFGLAQFSDVPAGHWAKEAVEALAAKGLILGFPDGTFRGNENLTRYQAALLIYRLLQQIEEELKAKGTSPTMEAMAPEDLEALKNAVQELAAELAALGVRVSALEDSAATKEDIARLESQIEELKAKPAEPGMDQAALQDLMDRVEAASIAADTALAQAQQLAEQLQALSQDVEGVKGDVAALSTQVESNAQAIQALNELAVLLNQDVLSLQDRVTALEKGLADLQGVNFEEFATKEDVAAVQEFAAALRSDLVSLSEKVSKLEGTVGELSGKVATLQRNAFSISGSLSLNYAVYRAWGPDAGLNPTFDIDRVFSSDFSTGDANNNGLIVDEPDLGQNQAGATTATLSLKLQTNALDAKSTPGGYNSYPGLVQFSLTGSWTNPNPGAGVFANLVVDKVSTTLAVAKDQALSFTFGRSVKTKFTEYVFDNDGVSYGHGLVATYKPGFLGATLTGVYASRLGAGPYARGARLTLAPLDGLSLGGSFVQEGVNIIGGGPGGPTVYGVDGSLKLGPVGLSGEYFSSSAVPNANGYYVKASAALGPVSLEGNYRNIGAGLTPANMLSYDALPGNGNNAAPFHADQQGYGVKAKVQLGPLALGGFYDIKTAGGFPRTAYGIEPSVGFGAFSLSGYYRVVDNLNNGTLDDLASSEVAAPAGFLPGGANYTQYGGKLSHDGTKAEALVKNLSFTASYDVRPYFAPGAQTDIAVYGTYSFGLAVLEEVKLLGRYHNVTVAGSPPNSYTTVKYGISAKTAPLAIPLKPGLFGEYVARSTQGGTANNAETKYAFGVKLGEFLFPNSSLEVKYGAYQGQNLTAVLVGNAEKAWDASSDVLYDGNVNAPGVNGSLAGYYLTWSYWDLVLSFAEFKLTRGGDTYGQGFKISYKVTF